MSSFYIIRHGQTHYNKAQQVSESLGEPKDSAAYRWDLRLCDSLLDDEGVSQCLEAAPFIRTLDVQKVFVSPLRRALQTCKILFENHPNRPKVIVFPQLHEILHNGHDVSMFERNPFDEFQMFDWTLMPQDFSSWSFVDDEWKNRIQHPSVEQILNLMKENPSICIESYKSVWTRAQKTKEFWRKELMDGNVAIVTHSTFLREFTKDQFEDNGIWLENCECREFRL